MSEAQKLLRLFNIILEMDAFGEAMPKQNTQMIKNTNEQLIN